ncbi:hypothetical protein D3C76_1783370 [compost metagenome]
MGVFRQRAGAFDQFDRDRDATQGQDLFQVVDADQRNVVMDLLGVGDEIGGALITFTGVEHRGHAITARSAHHRANVLR